MSKLCQCKQDTLHALVLGTATGAAEYEDDDDLDDFAYEQLNAIVKLLESDCVCEKKVSCSEKPNNSFKESLFIFDCMDCGFRVSTNSEASRDQARKQHDIWCNMLPKLIPSNSMDKQKQSQSPCEHEWEKIFLPAFTVLNNHWQPQLGESPNSLFPLYICRRKACGLVTCLDPNRSGPSKNPNDTKL